MDHDATVRRRRLCRPMAVAALLLVTSPLTSCSSDEDCRGSATWNESTSSCGPSPSTT